MPFQVEVSDVFGRQAHRQRQQQADQMAQELMTRGLSPDAINSVVNTYVRTGQLKIPNQQSVPLPMNLTESDQTERSTMKPVSFTPKKKQLYSFDKGTGTFSKGPVETDNLDPSVQTFDSTPPDLNGQDIYVNGEDSTEIRREPNGEKHNRIIRVMPHHESAGGSKDPEDIIAMDTMKKYQGALLRGDSIPDDFMDSVRSAADRLNLSMAEVQKDPSLIDRIQNKASDLATDVTGKPLIPPAKPKFDGTAARFGAKDGKPLTKAKAQEFLQRAGGNKEKARALARKENYSF
jgi:hypothetical protein